MNNQQNRIGFDFSWTTDAPNILTDENLRRVQRALEEGWVCGLHLYYAGGCGGDAIAFSAFERYLAHVEQARPGDLFYLFSVAKLRKKDLLLVDSRHVVGEQGAGSLLSPEVLGRVRDYLSGVTPDKILYEILAVASFGTTSLETVWTDLDGSAWEWLLDTAQRANVPGGALCVLPFTTIDDPGLYLLKAKRPNEKGEVPVGGAY
jgi:hypothetical protein